MGDARVGCEVVLQVEDALQEVRLPQPAGRWRLDDHEQGRCLAGPKLVAEQRHSAA